MNTFGNRLKKILKEYAPLILLISVFLIFVYRSYLFDHKALFLSNDTFFQYRLFYKEMANLVDESIRTRSLQVFSWNMFLGTDVLATKVYYCIGDFLFYPLYLFLKDIDVLLTVELILCISFSAVFMDVLLKKLDIEDKKIRYLISLAYAFSGITMQLSGNFMMNRYMMLMPLLYYFAEDYLQRHKLVGFAIITFILFLQDYEFMFSASLLLIIYFFVRKRMKGITSITAILKDALPLIASFLVGLVLSSAFMIPTILQLMGNSRMASFSSDGLGWSLKTLTGIVTSLFAPPINVTTNTPPFVFHEFMEHGHHYNDEFTIYVSSIAIVSYLILLKKGEKKEKQNLLVPLLILWVFYLIKPLNVLAHGLSVATLRWGFIIGFYNLLAAAYILNKYLDTKANTMKLTCLVVILVIGLSILFNVVYQFPNDLNNYLLLIIFLILFVGYSILCAKGWKYTRTLLLICMSIETLGSYAFLIYNTQKKFNIGEATDAGLNMELINYHNYEDPTKLYRVSINPLLVSPWSEANANLGIQYQLRTTMTYDSTYDTNLDTFLSLNDIYDVWLIELNDPEVMKMIGTKYVFVEEESQLIDGLDYTYAYNINQYQVYQINDFNSIGHTYTSFVTNSNQIDWNHELFVEEEDYPQLSRITGIDNQQLIVTSYSNNSFEGTIESSNDAILAVFIPYSSGWQAMDDAGNTLPTYRVQGGFLGVQIHAGTTHLRFAYRTPGFKTGVFASFAGFVLLILLAFWQRKLDTEKHHS